MASEKQKRKKLHIEIGADTLYTRAVNGMGKTLKFDKTFKRATNSENASARKKNKTAQKIHKISGI